MAEIVYTLATDDELLAEALRLSEQKAQPYLTDARKAQIAEKMCYLFFELNCRQQEEMECSTSEVQ